MAQRLELLGGKELRASLKAAGDDLADLKAAHAAAAAIIAAAAKGMAPRRTGRLATSIRGSGSKAEAIVQAGVVYAGVIEFGWPRRNIPGQPYLVPAARDTEPEWRPAYEAELQRIIAKVKGL